MKDFSKYSLSEEPIHLVYAYVFDEYQTCYVGRTKNLRKRHNGHKCGKKHSDGTRTYDSVNTFSKEHNIPIPEPVILEDGLTGKESLISEDFWVNKYKEDGWVLLNKAKTGIKSGSLGHIHYWTYEKCKEACDIYETKQDLRKNLPGCYYACIENGWINELIKKEGKHPNGYWFIKENVINEAKKYDKITDFIVGSIGAYVSAKRNGWLDELGFKNLNTPKEICFDEVWVYYKKTGNIKETTKHFHVSYERIKKLFNENGVDTGDHGKKVPLPGEEIKIQEDLDNGVPLREIERRYNISRKRIPKIFDMTKYEERRQKK